MLITRARNAVATMMTAMIGSLEAHCSAPMRAKLAISNGGYRGRTFDDTN